MLRRDFARKAGRVYVILLLMLGFGGVPFPQLSAQGPPRGQGVGANGELTLVTPEEIEVLLAKGTGSAVLPGLSDEAKETAVSRVSSLIAGLPREAEEGRLDAEGCYTDRGIYHKPPFILGDNEDRISVQSFVERAEVAVIAEVLGAQPGLVGNSLGTRIHFRVIRDLKGAGIAPGTEWYYGSRDYHFKVNGVLLCRRMNGFYHEAEGDVVFLVARFARLPKLVLPYGVFQVKDALLVPQPYEFLLPSDPIPISDLETELQ